MERLHIEIIITIFSIVIYHESDKLTATVCLIHKHHTVWTPTLVAVSSSGTQQTEVATVSMITSAWILH